MNHDAPTPSLFCGSLGTTDPSLPRGRQRFEAPDHLKRVRGLILGGEGCKPDLHGESVVEHRIQMRSADLRIAAQHRPSGIRHRRMTTCHLDSVLTNHGCPVSRSPQGVIRGLCRLLCSSAVKGGGFPDSHQPPLKMRATVGAESGCVEPTADAGYLTFLNGLSSLTDRVLPCLGTTLSVSRAKPARIGPSLSVQTALDHEPK